MFQRPQHLLSRASQQFKVWFIEEPIWGDSLRVDVRAVNDHLRVVVPHLPHGTPMDDIMTYQRRMVDELIEQERITEFVSWYYTPMALMFSDHLDPALTVYDCMDELSAFLGAPPQLIELEKDLLERAGVVFTGGLSLYEAKKDRHPNAHAFPSSIEVKHFKRARHDNTDPADQRELPHPRVGFSGVIDERFDVALVSELARLRPNYQFIFLGPIVKIDPATLPQGDNVHYLGMKQYDELPHYFGHWDAAILPFALNASTKFISPTKTPEYLAAGLPVVSTPIRDVVRTYGAQNFAQIADTADAFARALDVALAGEHPTDWKAIDQFLAQNSWDITWQAMHQLMQKQLVMD